MGDEHTLGDDQDLVFEVSDAGKASQDQQDGDFDLYDIPANEVENDVYAALYGDNDTAGLQGPQEHEANHQVAGEGEASHSSAGNYSEPGRPAEEAAVQEQPSTSGASQQQQEQHYGTSSSVYIGSLQWWTTDAEIEALCSPHGAVQKIRFFEEKPSGKSKGYCLVTLDSPKAAFLCRQSLDGKEINGKKCVVTLTKSKEEYAGDKAAGSGAGTGMMGRGQSGFRGRGQAYGGRQQRGGMMGGRQPYGQGHMGGMGGGQMNGRMGWQGGGNMPGPFMPGMGAPGMGMGMGVMGMGGPMGPPMPYLPPGMGMQGVPYRPNGMMDGPYGGRGFKRTRY
ncbi:g9793 [Coccomyxa viridis]|uniref:G9793 protein n=1 Tax=Coccomyxa viridis TaxID=1274662 RepID=A0ABP1G826_9CHLO